jgi:hypothetical protein
MDDPELEINSCFENGKIVIASAERLIAIL